jgi:hypothetical protein
MCNFKRKIRTLSAQSCVTAVFWSKMQEVAVFFRFLHKPEAGILFKSFHPGADQVASKDVN